MLINAIISKIKKWEEDGGGGNGETFGNATLHDFRSPFSSDQDGGVWEIIAFDPISFRPFHWLMAGISLTGGWGGG